MKKTSFLSIASLAIFMLALSSLWAQDAAQAVKTPEAAREKGDFHIYLLIGGSNMTGKVTFAKADKKTESKIFVLDAKNEWNSAETIFKSQDKSEDIADIGMGIAFGKGMLQNLRNDVYIGIINCASADSDIKSWSKGSPLYEKAVERTKLAQKSGVLKGIVWHQGEADAKSTDLKAYGEATIRLINDLRNDLAPEMKVFPLPFVGGKLYSYPFDKDTDVYREFNENLEKTYLDIDRHGLVETKGLKVKGSSTIFDNDSMIELGKRYAESMCYLYGKRK